MYALPLSIKDENTVRERQTGTETETKRQRETERMNLSTHPTVKVLCCVTTTISPCKLAQCFLGYFKVMNSYIVSF